MKLNRIQHEHDKHAIVPWLKHFLLIQLEWRQKVESMEAKIDKMEAQLETLIELANKGRGGFWMGMTFVSAISTVMGYFSHHWSK